MIKKTISIATLLLLILLISSIPILPKKELSTLLPIPTEIAENKAARKEKKKLRQEWMDNMHRTAPNTDWKAIDDVTRRERTQSVIQLRQSLKGSGRLEYQLSQPENIGSRNVSGVWNERGSNNLSGRIRTADIDFDNNLIYCASSGGQVWRGTIGGADWVSLTDYIRIPGISLIRLIEAGPTNHRLFIGASDGFYYTDDDGITLTEATGLNYAEDWGNAKRYIIRTSPVLEIYILAQEWDYTNWNSVVRIYKSTDLGQSFSVIHTFSANDGNKDNYDIWTSRYTESAVYVNHNGEFYSLINDVLTLITDFNPAVSGSVLLTGGYDGSDYFFYTRISDQIYKSINGGDTWVNTGSQPSGTFMVNSFNSSNIYPDNLAIGQIDTYVSSDGGTSWSIVNNWWEYYGNEATMLHADIPEIRWFIDNTGSEVTLISTDGGIYYSEDNLSTVSNLSLSGLGVSQYYSTYTKRTEPYSIYVGAQDQGFQRALNDIGGILDFEQSISGDYGHIISGDSGATLWTNYPGFTMYYANPEIDTWGTTLDFPGSGFLWLAPLAHEPTVSNIAYIGGGGASGGNHVIKLTEDGGSISTFELGYNFDSRVSAMAKSPIQTPTFYVLTESGNFYWSHNGGLQTWDMTQSFTGPEAHYFYGSCILPSSNDYGTVWISGSGYSNPGVYVSTDHGETFTSLEAGLPNTMVYQIATNDDESLLFAATEVGPYMLDESGSWEYMGELTAPDQVYWSVEFIPELNTVRFGTYGRGIWDFVIESDPCDLRGDFNLDETVNITDLIDMVQIIINNDTPTDDELCTSDLDHTNSIDIFDLLLLADILLN